MASFDVLLFAQENGLRPKTNNVFSPKKNNKCKASFINYKEKHFFLMNIIIAKLMDLP